MGFLDTKTSAHSPQIRSLRAILAVIILMGAVVVMPRPSFADDDPPAEESPAAVTPSVGAATCGLTVNGTATLPDNTPYANGFMSLRGYAQGERPSGGHLAHIWWATRVIGGPVMTDSNGVFEFCVEAADLQNPAIVGLQVVGISNLRPAPSPDGIGDTASAMIELPEDLAGNPTVTINVQMKLATVIGHTAGQAVELAVIDPATGISSRAMLTGSSGGGYAIAVDVNNDVNYRLSVFSATGQATRTIRYFRTGQDGIAVPVSTSGSPATPNMDLVVRQSDGSTLPAEMWADTIIRRIDGVCAPVEDEDRLVVAMNNCFPVFSSAGNDRTLAALENGVFGVQAQVNGTQTVVGIFQVTDGAVSLIIEAPVLSLIDGQLILRLAAVGDIWRTVDSEGESVDSLSLWVDKWAGNDFTQVPAAAQFTRVSASQWGWVPDQEGIYRIRMAPISGVTVAAVTYRYVLVSADPPAPVNFCVFDPLEREFACTTPIVKEGSVYPIAYDAPNAIIEVCFAQSGVDDPPCRPSASESNLNQSDFPEVIFARADLDGNGRVQREYDYRGSVLFEALGHAYVPVTENSDQIITVEIRPPANNPTLLAAQKFTVSVSAGGVWNRCVASGDAVCGGQGIPIDVIDGRRDLGRVDLVPATIIGRVTDPSGQPVPRTWVSARICDEDPDFPGCFRQVIGVLTRSGDARFGFDLGAGDYELHLNPPWGATVTYSPNSVRITVGGDGRVTHINGAEFAGGELALSFLSPNVTGRVTALGAPRLFVSVAVEKWNGQRFDYTGQMAQTDRTGQYRLRLGEGRWRLTARPQGVDITQFSIGQLEVTVDAQGRITEVDGTELPAPATAEVDLAYGVPNLSGTVMRPDGTTPVAWAGVGAERWTGERYEHAAWATTSRTGGFAMHIARGVAGQPEFYRLGVQPPRGTSGLSRTLWIVRVPSEGPLCVVAAVGANQCVDGLDAPPFTLTMGQPNLLTRVTASGQPQAAQVQVRRWDQGAFGFDWIDVWATAGPDGNADLLAAPGDYQIAAEPRAGSGFARGVRYVRVPEPDAGSLCEFTLENSGSPAQDGCTPIIMVNGRIEVSLQAANLLGVASYTVDAQQRPLSGGWIDLFAEVGSERRWVASTGVDRQGVFGFRLDVPAGPVIRYRVFVNPPTWDAAIAPLGLVRTSFVIWAIPSGGSTLLCAEDPAEADGGVCPAGKVVSAASPQSVQVTGGNVLGDVHAPDGVTDVTGAQVQVERQEGSRYVWTTDWAQSGGDGTFALTLPEGTYRISVRPPRTRIDLSPSSQVISVKDDGSFCLGVGACQSSISRLAMTLTQPNLTGVLQRSVDNPQPVPRAWIGVEEPVGASYRWTALGTQTDGEGRFAINLPAAAAGATNTYRITVEPPFGSTAGEVRFTRLVTVNDTGQVAEDLSVIRYPAANFDVVLAERPMPGESAGPPVRGAWVYLERQVPDSSPTRYQWADLAATSQSNGRVALRIPVPSAGVVTYRMTVTPPWDRTGLARFTRLVTIDDAGLITVADEPDAARVRFPAANVRGFISLDASTPNQFGWIQVRSEASTFEGTSTTATGAFALSLPGGEADTVYTLTAFANPSQALRQPLRLQVTVSAEGLVTGWNRVGETMTACGESCVIEAQFPPLVPNLEITVDESIHGTSTPVVGAFLRLTCTGGACNNGDRLDLISGSDGVARDQIPPGVYGLSVVAVGPSGEIRTFNGSVAVPDSGALSVTVTITVPA